MDLRFGQTYHKNKKPAYNYMGGEFVILERLQADAYAQPSSGPLSPDCFRWPPYAKHVPFSDKLAGV
jgi:hypothetical protein